MFSFLNRQSRNRHPHNDCYSSTRGDIHAGEETPNAPATLAKPASSVDPGDYDLSYEDALLDRSIREALNSEFGAVDPPRHVYAELRRKVDVYERRRYERAMSHPLISAVRLALARVWLQVRRAPAGPATARFVPAAVSVALILMLVGTNLTTYLNDGQIVSRPLSSATYTPAGRPTVTNLTEATNRYERYTEQFSGSTGEAVPDPINVVGWTNVYSPANRDKGHIALNQDAPMEEYWLSRFGPY